MDSNRLLGDFLRARREATGIEDVGLIAGGRRRTPGLRREEVAMLAGVSIDYYIRLEQGRERRPSEQVLNALARVFSLDAAAAEHMHELARPRPRHQQPAHRREQVSPALLRFLDKWDHTPAFILDRYLDMLARNKMADVLYEGLHHNDNILRLTFLNPDSAGFYLDWQETAYSKVGQLRASAGTDPDDPYLPELIEELSQSEEFRRIWARHDVLPRTNEMKRFRHAIAGEMTLSYESLTVNSAPGQQLVIFQAEPGSASERAMAMLGEMAGSPLTGPPRVLTGAQPQSYW